MNISRVKKTRKLATVCVMGTLLSMTLSTVTVAADHARNITDKEINETSNTADWLAYGRTHSEQRFSPLKDINVKNVGKLKPEWYFDIPDKTDMASTPLVVDGVMYHIGHLNVVRAIDARTGKKLWEYDPKVAKEVLGKSMRRVFWGNSRGLSTYGDKLYIATWDGRIVATIEHYRSCQSI